MPKYYSTLPTTDREVADLLQNHGYTDPEFLLENGLTIDQIAAMNGSLVLYNDRHAIRFKSATSKEINDVFSQSEDVYDRHYDLLIAEVDLALIARHRSLRDGSIMKQFLQPIMLPVAVTADVAPDKILKSVYSSPNEMSTLLTPFHIRY